MRIAASLLKLFAFIRRRWTARPTRSLADWIALTIARVLSFAVVGGLVYVTYIVEMTGFDDFRRCNKTSTMTRLEWVLGFRPAEDCSEQEREWSRKRVERAKAHLAALEDEAREAQS